MEEVENVRVVVRVRPMNEAEVQANYENAVEVDSTKGTLALMPPNKGSEPPKVFTFDLVFGPDSKQVRGIRISFQLMTWPRITCLTA